MTVTVETLKRRLAAVPETLQLSRAMNTSQALPLGVNGFDLVGVGASALPARVLGLTLAAAGLSARRRSLVEFHPRSSGPQNVADRCLVVFSQGLSPNACLALKNSQSYGHVCLFTAVDPNGSSPRAREVASLVSQKNVSLVLHPPHDEGGALLRIVGPIVAAEAALRQAQHLFLALGLSPERMSFDLGALDDFPERLMSHAPADTWVDDPVAWVSARGTPELAASLAWTWQEGLRVPAAPAVDALEFSHGLLQSLYETSGTILVLSSGTPADVDLTERIIRVVAPGRHQVIPLVCPLPTPLSILAQFITVQRELLAQMAARGIDPAVWPAQDRDAPLYRLGE